MSKTPEIVDKGLSYTKPDTFGKPRSHFYATNSMLNYQYGGPMLNSVKHVFGNGGFKPMVKNIPSPYQFAGTKIYRDTTEIPNYRQGGNLEQPWLSNLYPNGGQLYTYAARPEAIYQKDEKGNWYIKLPSTNGKFVPLNDPTGQRAGELEEKAKPYVTAEMVRRTDYGPSAPVPSETTQQVAQNYMMAKDSKEYAQRVDQARLRANIQDPTRLYGNMSKEQLQGQIDALTPEEKKEVQEMMQEYHDPTREVNQYNYLKPNSFTEAIDWRLLSDRKDWNKWATQQWNQNKEKKYANETEAYRAFLADKMKQRYIQTRPAPSAANNYNDSPMQSADWFWTLPLGVRAAAGIIPNVLKSAGIVGRTPLPFMSSVPGATYGNLLNSGFIANSMYQFPGNVRDWYDVTQGNKNWKEAAEGTGEIALGLVGTGYGKGVKSLKQDITAITPIAQANIGNKLKSAFSFPNASSFVKETVGSVVNPNRAQSLREAENWMTAWMQHPVTQKKIEQGYKFGLHYPKNPSKFQSNIGMYNIPYNQKIMSSPIEMHNFGEGIKYSSGYNATGKLGEYPLKKQLLDLVELGKEGIHADNIGVSYTHDINPGEWLSSGNTFNNLFKTQQIAPTFPRYGNWISRALSPENRVSTGIHELTHDAVRASTLKKSGQSQILHEGIDPGTLSGFIMKYKDNPKVLEQINYFSEPTEIHARVMQARKHFGLTPETVVTPEMAGNMMKTIRQSKTPIDLKWSQLFTDNQRTANMFNKAWMAPAAIGGGTAATLANPWSNENTQLNLGLRQGGMLKRADGSYSQRGLWDNIRANAGSGKEPTKEMLAQERKINNEYRNGGKFQTSYYSSDVNDNYYAEGGFFSKKKDKNTTGLLATDIMQGTPGNPLITPILPNNEAFPLPIGSSINTEPTIKLDPNAVIDSFPTPTIKPYVYPAGDYADQAWAVQQQIFPQSINTVNDWYKNWYAGRMENPKFTNVATERYLAALNRSTPFTLEADPEFSENHNALLAVTYKPKVLDPANESKKNQIFINNAIEPDAGSNDYYNEKFIDPEYSGNYFIREGIHEKSHWDENNFRQPGTDPYWVDKDVVLKDILPKPKYNKNTSIYNENRTDENPHFFNADFKGGLDEDSIDYLSLPTEIRARLNVWRQLNNIDPTKNYSVEELQKIMDQNIKDGYERNEGDYRNIIELYHILQGNPEVLKTLNDEFVQNDNPAGDQLNMAKNGGFLKTFKTGGSLPKPYSLPEDSFRQGARNLHNSIYASTPGQYPQPYENGGSLIANSAMPMVEPVQPNIIPASAFSAPVEFYPETYADIEKSDGTTYKKGLDGAWYISGPRAKNYTLMNDPAGIWADSLETGIRQAKVVPVSQIPIVDNSYKV